MKFTNCKILKFLALALLTRPVFAQQIDYGAQIKNKPAVNTVAPLAGGGPLNPSVTLSLTPCGALQFYRTKTTGDGWDCVFLSGADLGSLVVPVANGGTGVSAGQPFLNTALFSDVTSAAATRGDLVTAQGATPKWNRLAVGLANQFLVGGTEPSWRGLVLNSADFANQGTVTTVLHGNAAGNPAFGAVTNSDLNITSTSCTNQFVSALSTSALGTCTTPVWTSGQFANQGTEHTVLHGNAAGNPAFGAVTDFDLNITGTACGNQFVTALNTSALGTCTTANLTSAQFANQGTATTLLHGNAAGNPTWSGVSLTADAAANQGATNKVLHGNAAGQPSFDFVTELDMNITATGCVNQFISAISPGAQGTCTTPVLTSGQFANQGTTTTLLHGNAAGNPTWSGVSLTADAAANQGATNKVLHGNAAGQPSFGFVTELDMNITGTGCVNQFVSAISPGAQGTCTTATLASAQFANQGTTTTVLHGNASGNPSFGAVSLAADVTGNLDAEASGITITAPSKVWLPAAGCNGSTPSTFWDLPTSSPAVAACVTGTNTQKGVLDYADTAGGFSAQTTELLAADWTGNIDARIIWFTTATTGNVKWSLSTICTDVSATATDDPAFNTPSTVTTAAPGTANRIQTSAITSVTITGCSAGQLLHLKLFRDGNDASDTIAATARLYGVELTLRRAM